MAPDLDLGQSQRRRTWFGFVVPPLLFYLFLVAAVAAYLLLVELAKRAFFRHFGPRVVAAGRRLG